MYVRSRGFGRATSPGRRTWGLGQTSGAAQIAATIQRIEGYYPGTIAYANNNPGNLIYEGQAGATPGSGGFAVFSSYSDGYQALLNQIDTYANQGITIEQMMEKYSPAPSASCTTACAGNNPQLYASNIANSLGVSTDTTVADAIAGGSSLTSDLDGLVDDSGDDSVDSTTIDPVLLAGGVLLGALALGLIAG